MTKEWADMTSDERQEALFARWMAPKDPEGKDLEFQSPQTKKAYQDRVTRIKDAIQMKKLPDRVPVILFTGFFPAYYAEITPREAMYDYDKLYMAFKKYQLDFEPDGRAGLATPGPGRVFDILDYKVYGWPGHGVSPNHVYQCIEGEYMTADEYDSLIRDPSYFFTTTYFPRTFGRLEALKMLSPITNVFHLVAIGNNLISYGLPEVQAAYKALFEAGSEALKWAGVVRAFNNEMTSLGFPANYGGITFAPFDMIGDTLRGTKGIMLDMYRRPDKLLQALETVVPLMIRMGASGAMISGNPLVFIPLHKGADGFLSDAQFKKLYWPTFRKLLLGLINEGCIPWPFAEGSYNSRLETIGDLPKGKVVWSFDQIDMSRAKKILGSNACISGNMPPDLLAFGTPQQVKDYAKKLIDTVGKNGGFIMANGAFLDEAKPENVHAMIDFTKKYGVYR